MAGQDYYQIIGVSKTATEDEIKKAARKLMMANHPDRQQGKTDAEKAAAEAAYKQANEIRDVLMDSKLRAAYDRNGEDGVEAARSGKSSAAKMNINTDMSDIRPVKTDLNKFYGADVEAPKPKSNLSFAERLRLRKEGKTATGDEKKDEAPQNNAETPKSSSSETISVEFNDVSAKLDEAMRLLQNKASAGTPVAESLRGVQDKLKVMLDFANKLA